MKASEKEIELRQEVDKIEKESNENSRSKNKSDKK
jgi:hypothetical protein